MRRSHGFDVVPWQQLVDIDLFVPFGDGRQDTRQISVWLNPVKFAGFDQGRDDGPVFCPCIMTCEEGVFAIESNWTDGAFDGIVVELDGAIVKEQAQPVPVFGDALPGSRNTVSMRGDFKASPVGDLAEIRARFWASQSAKLSMMGFERSCRASWRWSADRPRRSFSMR